MEIPSLAQMEQLPTAPTLHCDNKLAIRSATTKIQRGVRSHIAADIDVITKIHRVKSKGIPLDTLWVKSHQDDNTDSSALDLPAQLNCKANAAAGAFLAPPPASLSP
eukprot:14577997-Ditylum_brightwellii.AAC.1